tara:strand:- start:5825 stop:6136 length:312 start_codon:yes stop_codon:yes gene_type:complete
MFFPKEIWNHIIEFTNIHKNIHKKKLTKIIPIIKAERPTWIWHTHYKLKTDIYEIQLYKNLSPEFFFDPNFKPITETIYVKGKFYNFDLEQLDTECMNHKLFF